MIKNTLIVRVNYYETVNPSLWKVPWVTSWKAHSVQIQMYTIQICHLCIICRYSIQIPFLLYLKNCLSMSDVKNDNIWQRKSNFLGHKCQAIEHFRSVKNQFYLLLSLLFDPISPFAFVLKVNDIDPSTVSK